ncbi:hypothetical protein EXIGLDRAFT_356987 [Exidia glandulosa HHB12029]|uniref:Uncharacterized protein n=1 Tax=Exidia glandulosa HHB12029 TaxID=1314781 RepID=A0A165C946_EXIGL|nr:hypothetical protein EXIGLDRAFT_356987 [Exidia glandulosa HHB12029]
MAHSNFYRRAAFQLGPDLCDLPAPAFGDGQASSSNYTLYKFASFQCGPRVGSLPPPISDEEFEAVRRAGGGAERHAVQRKAPEGRSSSSGVRHAWTAQTDENNVQFGASNEAIERTGMPATSLQMYDAPSSSSLGSVPAAHRLGESGSRSISALSPTSTVSSNALDEATTTPQHVGYAFGDVNTHATPRAARQLPQPTDHCPGRRGRRHAHHHYRWVPVDLNGRRADILHLLAALSPQQQSINVLH